MTGACATVDVGPDDRGRLLYTIAYPGVPQLSFELPAHAVDWAGE